MSLMAGDLDSVYNLAALIALVVEASLYGVYVPLFFVCLWIMVSRKDIPNWKLIVPLVTMFILSTTHIAVTFYIFIESFMESSSPKDLDCLYPALTATDGLYNVLNFIGDGIVIYRCYVICSSGFMTVASLILLHLAATSTGICSTAIFGSVHYSLFPMTEKLGLTSRCLSLVLNATCTGLITHRILNSTRMISPVIGPRRAARCYVALVIIVESAALYTIVMAVLIGTYAARAPTAAVISYQMSTQIVVLHCPDTYASARRT
ncbi:hypothetical protein BOTBODRAFT_170743 [Botryobasidium botryosum FD-172 SS1]|uniref:Uncharacterized protein n=1 Tax=Botryobasidium botryosum (strain FD-172 SS1) TaxID=930990 RepID=A0A067N7C8_BOTB1|nr:hypothetical protein BOTBODRAFT_170743 [Botryobasidium botryosum FD-172 SS1]